MLDKLQQYLDANKMHNFEGHTGVDRMKKIMRNVCGYEQMFSGLMENFFADNPGAIQAVVEWIESQNCPEWANNLDDLVGEEDEVSEGEL
jgi:hypothetical protein